MNARGILALTPQGATLARSIRSGLGADLWLPRDLAREGEIGFTKFKPAVTQVWQTYAQVVFIAASGLVIRSMAPLLESKDKDPAVVVFDHQGRYAVSLLSGHLGGANDLAREAAALTGGQAVITTATDSLGLTAIDQVARIAHMTPEPVQAIKDINTALICGHLIQVRDPENRLGWEETCPPGYVPVAEADPDAPAVRVGWDIQAGSPAILTLRPRCLVAGIGCNTQTPAREILDLIRSVFSRYRLAPASLTCMVSTSKKAEEPGIIQAASELGVEFVCIPHHRLQGTAVPTPSETVRKHMGVPSICEAAALIHSGHGRLIVPKTKSHNATLAVALHP